MQTGDIKTGMTFKFDGKIYTAVEWQHVCQPRLAGFIRARIKNVETGAVLERNFKTNENVEVCQIERKEMEYLYSDNDIYYFMDMETFETIPVSKDMLPDSFKFVKEEMMCKVLSYKGSVFSVEPPMFVELEVVATEPGVRGNTATGASKPATLETGAVIKVPLFIDNGTRLRIDTRTGEYIERA